MTLCEVCRSPMVGVYDHWECWKCNPPPGAVKHDTEKVRLDLLPFGALEEVGRVFTYGARKYADHNYRKGMRWSRLLAATLRHLFAWARGEDRDPESGERHLAHAACCILMLLDADLNVLGEDDRWRKS